VESSILEKKALELGFSNIAFLDATNPSEKFIDFYNNYLKNNFHAKLNYLENTKAKYDLNQLLENVQTIVVLMHPYLTKSTIQKENINQNKNSVSNKQKYKISKYAQGRDYHIVLKKKIKKIFRNYDDYKIIVDSTPLPEHYYARKTNLGFIGRNSLLIHPHQGSFFFLSFCLFKKKINFPEKIHPPKIIKNFVSIQDDINTYCKDCERCVLACPTNALIGNGLLNSNKCISYQTIENKNFITSTDSNNQEKLEMDGFINPTKFIFGCDICQDVCPYNKKSLFSLQEDFTRNTLSKKLIYGHTEEIHPPDLFGTALKRTGLEKIKQNIATIKQF